MLKNRIANYWLIFLILGIALFTFFHNAFTYPVEGGMDYLRRIAYTNIISHELRFPKYTETTEVYDAPLFYLISGLYARLFSWITNHEFLEVLATSRFLLAILGVISFFFWYKIFSGFYPKKKGGQIFFILWLSSIPVFYRAGAMYVSELLTFFIATVTIYFFANKYLVSQTRKNTIRLALLLSIGLLTRISFFSLVFSILIGLGIFFLLNKKRLAGIKEITIIVLILIILVGWFYIVRHSAKPLDFGTYKEIQARTSTEKKRGIDFYLYIPFTTMMKYPFRPVLSSPSYLLPIYYSDFWGDYWNYFPQTRFSKNELSAARESRRTFSNSREKYLSWQNWVNLLPTLLMGVSFCYLLFSRSLLILKNKFSRKILTEFIFCLFVIFTLGGMAIIMAKYPGQGDWIKATYTLYAIPVYVYLACVFLFSNLRKTKIIYWLVILVVLFSIVNNFIFSWF